MRGMDMICPAQIVDRAVHHCPSSQLLHLASSLPGREVKSACAPVPCLRRNPAHHETRLSTRGYVIIPDGTHSFSFVTSFGPCGWLAFPGEAVTLGLPGYLLYRVSDV